MGLLEATFLGMAAVSAAAFDGWNDFNGVARVTNAAHEVLFQKEYLVGFNTFLISPCEKTLNHLGLKQVGCLFESINSEAQPLHEKFSRMASKYGLTSAPISWACNTFFGIWIPCPKFLIRSSQVWLLEHPLQGPHAG